MKSWKKYNPEEKQYPEMNEIQLDMWKKIIPSYDGDVEYKPCQVRLKNGQVIDRVYIIHAQQYINSWGVWPEDDPAKKYISITDVVDIIESPNCLPPEIANKIYKAGESGMGYVVFTLVFKDRSRQAYLTGNAVDFLKLPEGKTYQNIADVIIHKGNRSSIDVLDYFWCLFGSGKFTKPVELYTLR